MCLVGKRTRSRTCTPPENGGRACQGEAGDEEQCNFNGCEEDGQWGPWGSWESCDRSCGGGIKYRTRYCTPPKNGGTQCVGPSEESRGCNNQACEKKEEKGFLSKVIDSILPSDSILGRLLDKK